MHPPKHHHRNAIDSVAARLDRLEHADRGAAGGNSSPEIAGRQRAGAARIGRRNAAQSQPTADVSNSQVQQLQAEVEDLKRVQAAQYADVQSQRQSDVQTSFKNGRPTFKTADGNFSASLRALVQFDSAYYMQGKMPAGIDFSSGSNFRRARLGFSGTLYKDWSYEFLYDLGGSGVEGATIASAYLQYDGLGPVHLRARRLSDAGELRGFHLGRRPAVPRARAAGGSGAQHRRFRRPPRRNHLRL